MELNALAILSYGKEFSLLNRQESKKSLLPVPEIEIRFSVVKHLL